MAYEDFKDLTTRLLLRKYCMIKHLILLKIYSMMDINVVLLQWYINFLRKKNSATRANKFAGSDIKNENIILGQ